MAEIETIDALTPRQHKALLAILNSPSIRQAAQQAEVPEKTIYNWLKVPEFQAEYRAARREATSQAIARLQQSSGQAAATLVRLMASGNPAAVRLAAASKVLDLAIKTVELEDLAARLEALEQRYAEKL